MKLMKVQIGFLAAVSLACCLLIASTDPAEARARFVVNRAQLSAEVAEVGWEAAIFNLVDQINQNPAFAGNKAIEIADVMAAAKAAQNQKKNRSKKPKRPKKN